MTTIVTRSGKGSPLTHTEVDTNFTNLNTAKLEAGAIALGSAATPSISFTGDTNTGIYSPGADQVAVATNGVQRINIEADGDINIDGGGVFYDATNNRLAIGTTSPACRCQIDNPVALSGSGNDYALIAGNASSASRRAVAFGVDGVLGNPVIAGYNTITTGVSSLAVDATQIGFRISGTEKAQIDGSGRLLVGTTTAPSNGELLSVNKASTGTEGAGIRFESFATIADDASITITIPHAGLIMLTNLNTGHGALVFATYHSATITIISDPSDIIATSDTDTKLCIFKSTVTNNITVKNRLGTQREIGIGKLTLL